MNLSELDHDHLLDAGTSSAGLHPEVMQSLRTCFI